MLSHGSVKPKVLKDIWEPKLKDMKPTSTPTNTHKHYHTPLKVCPQFKKDREGECRRLFMDYNSRVFEGLLPNDLIITWHFILNHHL